MDEAPDRQRAVGDGRYKYIRNYQAELPGAGAVMFREQLDLMRELRALHAAGALPPAAEAWFASPRPAEELYDTRADPHEVANLAGDPAHAATLARLRAALDDWLERTGDLGALPEAALVERFWPGGVAPRTEPVEIDFRPGTNGSVAAHLASGTPGASLGMRVDGGRWRVYDGPFELAPGQQLEARAVRYGWEPSEVVRQRTPGP